MTQNLTCFLSFPSSSRSKNTVNILIKNWLDMCIGALVYWAVGFAFTFGESTEGLDRFMGTSYFFFYDMPSKTKKITSYTVLCTYNVRQQTWVVFFYVEGPSFFSSEVVRPNANP